MACSGGVELSFAPGGYCAPPPLRRRWCGDGCEDRCCSGGLLRPPSIAASFTTRLPAQAGAPGGYCAPPPLRRIGCGRRRELHIHLRGATAPPLHCGAVVWVGWVIIFHSPGGYCAPPPLRQQSGSYPPHYQRLRGATAPPLHCGRRLRCDDRLGGFRSGGLLRPPSIAA